ncbi:MAG TPA: GNAT family N-acetyltransferase [Gaiellaceae bacterium]|nr:GNAT family N-acetyltransferase [Gaiellaceae bacterium]
MPDVTIRACTTTDELRQAAGAIVHYFGRDRPDDAWVERWLTVFELERMLAAVEGGGAIVGGAGAFSFRLTVPGGAALPAAGVTVVGVLPTHRRRGILRSMMRTQLDDARARGEQLAVLWASEETIYGRYGYGLASLALKLEVDKAHNAFRPGVETPGSVRLVDAELAAEQIPPIYDAVQRATPGMYERNVAWWKHRMLADPENFRFGGGPKQFAVLELDGRPAAYAIYRLHVSFGDLGPETVVRTLEVMADTSEATASIWRYLLDVDWTKTVSAGLLPVDHPLMLLLARPNYAKPTLSDALWVRLVDVGGALSGRTYADGAAVVFEVRDEFCPWNAGRWRLEGGSASRTDDAPDVALDVSDLASVYLGGFTFRALHRAGRVEELREGALYGADAIFRTDGAPWCPEIF